LESRKCTACNAAPFGAGIVLEVKKEVPEDTDPSFPPCPALFLPLLLSDIESPTGEAGEEGKRRGEGCPTLPSSSPSLFPCLSLEVGA